MCDINCIWLFNLLAAVVLIILQQQQQHVVGIEQHQQHPHQTSPYDDISSYAAVAAAKYLHRSTLPHNIVKRDIKNDKSTDFISYLNDFNIQDEASIPEDIIDQQHLQEIIDKQQQGLAKKADSTGNSASNDDGDFIDVNLPYDDSEAEVDIILESQRSSEGSDDNKTNNNNQNTGNNNQIEVVLVEDGDKVVKDKDKKIVRKTNKKTENLDGKKTLKANNNNGNIDNKNRQQQQKTKIKSENNIDYSNQYMYDVEEQDLEDANNDDDKFEKDGLDDDEGDDDDGSAEYEKFKTMHEQKQQQQQQQQQQKEHMSFLQKRLNERKFNNNNNPDLNEKIVNNNNKNNHDNDNGGDNLDNGNDDSYDNNNNKNDDYEKFHKYQEQQQQQQQQPKEDAIGDIEENENQSMAKTSNTNNNNNNNDHATKDLSQIFIPRKMKRHNGAARLDDVTNRHTRLRQQQQQELLQHQQKSQIDNDEEENAQKENVAKISSQEENFKKKYYDILKENSTQDHNHHRPPSAGEMPKDFSNYDEHNDREPTHEVQKQTAFEKEKMLRRNNKRYGHKTHKKKYKDYLRYSQIMMMTSTSSTTEQTPSLKFETTKKEKDETTTDKLIDRNGDLNALRDKHLAKLKLKKLKSLIPQAPIFFLKPKQEEKVVKEEEPKVEEPTAKPFYEGQINYFMETDDDDSERANAVRFITKGERVDTNDWYKKLSPVLRNGLKKSTAAPEERHGFAAVRAGYTPYHHYKHPEQSQSHSLHQQPRNHQYHHQHQQHHQQHHHQPHHRQVGKHSRHHAYQRKMMPRKSITTTTPLPPPSRQHLDGGDAIRQMGHQITDIKDFERYYAKWPHLAKVQSQLHEEQLREEQSENYPDYEYDNDDYWDENTNKDDNLPPYIRKYNRRNKQLLDLLEGTIAPPTKPVQQLRWSGSKLQPGPRDSNVGSMSVRIDDDYLKEKRKRYHQRQRQIHDLFAQQRQPTASTQATQPPTSAPPPPQQPSADTSANGKEEDGYLKASQFSHTENHFPDEDVSISLETNEHDNDYNNPKQHGINNDGHDDDDDVSKSANEQQHEEIWQKEIDTKSPNTGNSQLTWQMDKLITSTPATPLGAPLQTAAQKSAIFKLPSYPSIAGSFMNRPRSRSAQFAPSSGSEFRRVTLPYLNSNLENNHNNMNNNFINAGGFVAYNGAATNSKAITARFSQNTPNEYKQQQQQQQQQQPQQQLQEAPTVLQTQTTTGIPGSSAEKSLYTTRNNQHFMPPSSSVTNSFVYHRVVDASPRLVGAGILAGGGRKQRLPFVAITDRRLETSKKSLTDHQKDFEQNHYPLP